MLITDARVVGFLSVITALCLGAWGCQQQEREPAQPLRAAWETPAPAPAPVANAPASRPTIAPGTAVATAPVAPVNETIATVNGEPIQYSALVDALVEAHGLDMIEKFIVTTALRQRANALGITITDADVQDEYDDALRRITAPLEGIGAAMTRPSGTGAASFDKAAAEKVLDEFLTTKNIARSEFLVRMRQNAYLRKIAEHEVKVDDSQLPDEYKRAYGEKVQVRCIQLSSREAADRARAALETGKDFELVARQMGENRVVAARGGLLPPFTRFDDVPRLFRDAAFALQPGQMSATIHENNMFYILRLERRFPPSDVGIENVKDDLRARIKDRLVRERMDTLAGELFRAAAVQINDPSLRDAFRKRYPETRPSGAGRK
jgi:foldase protein PrsA